MTTDTPPPFDWTEQADQELVEKDSIPLIGRVPSFPWDQFAKELGSTFSLDEITVQHSSWEWIHAEKIPTTIGSPFTAVSLAMHPLQGTATLLISEDDLNTAISWILDAPLSAIAEESRQAFVRMILLEVIHHHQKVYPTEGLTPQIQSIDNTLCFDQPQLCTDCQISYKGTAIACRFAVSKELQQLWCEHHKEGPLPESGEELLEQVQVQLSATIGSVELPWKEWKQVSPGDFLLLDHTSLFIPEKGQESQLKGQVQLCRDGKPLFIAQLQEDTLTIEGYPNNHDLHEKL